MFIFSKRYALCFLSSVLGLNYIVPMMSGFGFGGCSRQLECRGESPNVTNVAGGTSVNQAHNNVGHSIIGRSSGKLSSFGFTGNHWGC